MPVINSKRKNEKLAAVAHILQNMYCSLYQNFVTLTFNKTIFTLTTKSSQLEEDGFLPLICRYMSSEVTACLNTSSYLNYMFTQELTKYWLVTSLNFIFMKITCVVPENIHTPSNKVFFSRF